MTGELDFYNYNSNQWVDAYTQWGISLEPGGMDALMAPPPNKQPVVNKNQTAWGAQVIVSELTDERTLAIPMHIVASTRALYYQKYYAFVAFVKNNRFKIRVKDYTGTKRETNELHFLECQNYRSFNGTMALFSLSVYEGQPKTFST